MIYHFTIDLPPGIQFTASDFVRPVRPTPSSQALATHLKTTQAHHVKFEGNDEEVVSSIPTKHAESSLTDDAKLE